MVKLLKLEAWTSTIYAFMGFVSLGWGAIALILLSIIIQLYWGSNKSYYSYGIMQDLGIFIVFPSAMLILSVLLPLYLLRNKHRLLALITTAIFLVVLAWFCCAFYSRGLYL